MKLQEKDLINVVDQIGQSWTKFNDKICNNIVYKVWYPVGSLIRRKIGLQVWNNIDEQFEKQIEKSHDT